jgi:hypothetical protein
MSPTPPPDPDVILPAVALAALARMSRGSEDGLAEALIRSGEETGRVLFAGLSGGAGADATGAFWQKLGRLFRRRGLGVLTHSRLHAGIGLIQISGSPESVPSPAGDPLCPFSTGVLRGILSAAAGRQVDLRALGTSGFPDGPEPDCRWVFGSTPALDQLNALLRSGQSLEDAVARL